MYAPQNPVEHAYFDSLWQTALVGADAGNSLDSELSGKAAVQFFQRSNIDTSYLKMVWSLSTPTATMSKPQFYTALRYISMIQNGDVPISKERMLSGSQMNIGLPRFSGIDAPSNPAVLTTPGVGAPPSNSFTAVASPTPATSTNNTTAYAITAIDHGKYHDLFVSYDNDRDGYLTAEESMSIFRKSGLHADLLMQVFQLADCDKDSRLTSKEFSIAFHLILCNTKKGLPVPTSGLPPMLKGFLANAPNVPGPIPASSVPVPAAYPSPSPVPLGPSGGPVSTPVSTNPTSTASFAPAAGKTVSISSAFGDLDPAVLPQESAFGESVSAVPTPSVAQKEEPSYVAHRPPPYSSSAARRAKPDASAIPADGIPLSEETEQLQGSMDAIKQVTRRALSAHEQAVDGSDRLLSSLTNIKQKLAVDKISLEATLSNLQRSSQESQSKLDSTVKEIAGLQQQLAELRSKLEEAHKEKGTVEEQLNRAQLERQEMLRNVQSALAALAAAQQNSTLAAAESATAAVSASQAADLTRTMSQQQGQLQADLKSTHEEVQVLQQLRDAIQKNILAVKTVTEAAKAQQLTATTQLQQERHQQKRVEEDVISLRSRIDDANKQRSQIISGITEDTATLSALPAKGPALLSQQGSIASTATSGSTMMDGAPKASMQQLHEDPFADLHSSTATQNTASGRNNVESIGSFHPEDDAFGGLEFDTTPVAGSHNIATQGNAFEEKGLFADSSSGKSAQSPEEDPFDSFGDQEATKQGSSESDDPFQSVTSLPGNASDAITNGAPAANFGELYQDPFVGFDGTPPAAGKDVTAPIISVPSTALSGDPFDAFGEQPATATATVATETTTSPAIDDPFDAFGAEPAASIDTSKASTILQSNPALQLDDPFDAFAGESSASIPSSATPTADDPFDAFGGEPVAHAASDFDISTSATSQESVPAASIGSHFPAFDAFASHDSMDAASAPSVFPASAAAAAAEVDPFAAFPTSSFAFPAEGASIDDPFAPTGQPDLKGADTDGADPFASVVGSGDDLFASAPSFPSFPDAFSSGSVTAAANHDPFAFSADAAAGGADPFAAFE